MWSEFTRRDRNFRFFLLNCSKLVLSRTKLKERERSTKEDMPKHPTDLEAGQTTLSFALSTRAPSSSFSSPVPSTSSSASDRSTQQSPYHDSRDRRRTGRGRGRGSTTSSAPNPRHSPHLTLIADENISLHLPFLLSAFPAPPSTSHASPPVPTKVLPLEGGKKTRFRFRGCDSLDAAQELCGPGRFRGDQVGVLNMFVATPSGRGSC